MVPALRKLREERGTRFGDRQGPKDGALSDYCSVHTLVCQDRDRALRFALAKLRSRLLRNFGGGPGGAPTFLCSQAKSGRLRGAPLISRLRGIFRMAIAWSLE